MKLKGHAFYRGVYLIEIESIAREDEGGGGGGESCTE